MARVFISYSRHDTNYVSRLVAALEGLGLDLFFDETSLIAGQKWDAILSTGLRKADAVLFILSRNSIQSKSVLSEIGAAYGYLTERGRPVLIPIVIDDAEIPINLNQFQAIIDRQQNPEDVALKVAMAIEHHIGRAQAQAEKQQEVRQRVESSAQEFIQASLADLRKREAGYKRAADWWYGVAFTCLVVGLIIGLWRAMNISGHLSSWIDLGSFVAVALVVLGLLIAVARFSFMLGKSFMVEALRVSDRIHAISFGAFYLNAFPDDLKWEHVKDAFQNWNIDKGSYFLSQSVNDFDNEVLRTAITLVEAVKGSKSK